MAPEARELDQLITRLRDALDRFGRDSRIASYVQRDIPDARVRLAHVVKLTEDAAHRTMDLVERCGPLAARTASESRELATLWRDSHGTADAVLHERIARHLEASARDGEQVRANLAEVVLAQGFQDLSGQIIRNVIALVSEIESALTELVPTDGSVGSTTGSGRAVQGSVAQGFGPSVPDVDRGAVSKQSDVDDLLADLGM